MVVLTKKFTHTRLPLLLRNINSFGKRDDTNVLSVEYKHSGARFTAIVTYEVLN